MIDQTTDSIRLAALDQYIIDQSNNHNREIERLRTDRTLYAILFILSTIGMVIEANLAIECSKTNPTTTINR